MKVSQVVLTVMSVLLVQGGGAILLPCEASVSLINSGMPSQWQPLSEQTLGIQASDRLLAQEEEGSGEEAGSGDSEEGCPDANEDNQCDVIEEGHGD